MEKIIETQSGKIEGKQFDNYIRFLGIPYAKTPVGELRFRRTQKIDRWEEVYKAEHFSARCPQPKGMFNDSASRKIISSEDCLTLNIWTPACDGKKRPVLFWIYGGGFLTGEASLRIKDGKRLCVEGGMVVVSINYRLGAFGFYDFTQLKGARGRFDDNCGMYDQVTALEWVRDNISFFGGDPDDITAVGESAGAISVQTLLVIPRVKGFIKKAIMESSCPFLPFTKESAKISALELLKELDLPEEQAYRLAEMPADILVAASNRVYEHYVDIRPMGLATAPVIDGDLIPGDPFDLIINGASGGIPLLIGTTKDEASAFVNPEGKNCKLPYNEAGMDKFFSLNPWIEKKKMLAVYPGYPSFEAIKAIGQDLVIQIGNVYMADAMSSTAPVWMYRFDYVLPICKMMKLGAVHTEENLFVCGEREKAGIFMLFAGKDGKRVAEDTHVFWRNFIKYGNPNGTGVQTWPEYGKERKTFIFNKEYSVILDPSHDARIALQGIRPYIHQ
jgi:para-nitrobenzyl esterase